MDSHFEVFESTRPELPDREIPTDIERYGDFDGEPVWIELGEDVSAIGLELPRGAGRSRGESAS